MPTKNDTITVGLTQMACSDDLAANTEKQLRLIARAADEGAQVVCTQELFRGKYFCQAEDHRFFDWAEPIPGDTTRRLSELARERQIVVIASLFEKRAVGVYHNTAVVFEADGSTRGIYRKMHVPDDPLYYEKFYFTPGDTGFVAFETTRGNVGTLVCWDQWFPEAARLTALAGADILFYPTAIGWHPSEKTEYGHKQHEAWVTMMRSHAVANGCFVCAPNRIGHELLPQADGTPHDPVGIEFWGQSFIAAPDGEIIAKASIDTEEVLVHKLDMARVLHHRTHWPFFRDRRIDAYGEITKRYRDGK
ncbi:MAG: carbon-nitrogen hydrolase [Phycisphaerae bacterium]